MGVNIPGLGMRSGGCGCEIQGARGAGGRLYLQRALEVVDLPPSVREELHDGVDGSTPPSRHDPPAANEGLMSLVPDFILGPRKVLDFGELQQPGRRGTTRFFGTGSRVPMDWAASASKPGRQSFHRTSRTAILAIPR